jgi:ribosome-associated protein
MRTLEFPVRENYVELCQLLKLTGLASSGGAGQQMVLDGLVRVDGQPEHRKRAKIRAGQVVECPGTRIVVTAPESSLPPR